MLALLGAGAAVAEPANQASPSQDNAVPAIQAPALRLSNRIAPSPWPEPPVMVAVAAPQSAPPAPAPQNFLAGIPAPRPAAPAATVVAAPPHGTESAAPARIVEAPAPRPVPVPPAVAAAPKPPVVAAMPVPRITPVPVPEVLAAGDDPYFPHLAILKPEVSFWTKVLSEWSENESVVHSMDDVRKIYTVLDFRQQAETMNPVALWVLRHREEEQAKEEIDNLLKRVDALQATPEKMTSEERRVYDMYADSRDPHRFHDAIGSFRVQHGLRERTSHALVVSGRYMPQMEQIFSSYGLPTRLTRLPLVESSFNLDAYSKAGAAGIWQFIPSSARIYMRLDEIADDRRDPWISTDAAARHLKDDYNALQNWPLAITAYNYGRGGLLGALDKIGGRTLDDLLVRFDSDRFGFASRNYYAEFVAANDVERDWRTHFGDIQREAPTSFETVETKDYVPYATLRRMSGISAEEFHTLNPAYNDEVVDGRLYVPPGQIIRVPAGSGEHFRLAYASLDASERFDQQRSYYAMHKIERGDSIARLAHRFGVAVSAILAANDLGKSPHLRAGETIRIPPHDSKPITLLAEATAEPAPHAIKTRLRPVAVEKHQNVRIYHVQSGQTLSAIAHRFKVSVDHLREVNGLSEASPLHVGSALKVPLR